MSGWNKRENDLFLSHSGQDKSFTDRLYHLLTNYGRLKVFYDRNMTANGISSELYRAINDSRHALIVYSENAKQSQWVREEIDYIVAHKKEEPRFKMTSISLDGTLTSGLSGASKHLDFSGEIFPTQSLTLLFSSLFGGELPKNQKSVFASKSWSEEYQLVNEHIEKLVGASGLQLICDRMDQPNFDQSRILEMLEEVGGYIAILTPRFEGKISPYILREMNLAADFGYPIAVVADVSVEISNDLPIDFLARFDANTFDHDKSQSENIEFMLSEFWSRIDDTLSFKESFFMGHSFARNTLDTFGALGQMVSKVSGREIVRGEQITGNNVQQDIIERIVTSKAVIIDITADNELNLPEKYNFSLNSVFETGVAMGARAEKRTHVLCKGPRRSPPFMLRNTEVSYYDNDAELVSILFSIARNYRREIIN